MRRFVKAALIAALILCAGLLVKGSITQPPIGNWLAAGSMTVARSGAASALLQDGRILITGGDNGAGPVASAEVFDTTGSFVAAPVMGAARSAHSATVLTDGRILVAGGSTGAAATNAAEIFDPAANAWTPVPGGMIQARANHTASLLSDGRVLFAGGDNAGSPIASLEIFDPAANSFSSVGVMTYARTSFASAILSDGQVILIGGSNGSAPLASTEIFDPANNSVTPGPALSTTRMAHSATTLIDGRVLVVGGTTVISNPDGSTSNTDLASAEIYDPATGNFTVSTSSLAAPRRDHAAFLLPNNGSVLIVGGTSAGNQVGTAEMFLPSTGTFAATGSPSAARKHASGSALSLDGILFLAGGSNSTGTLSSAELYGFATVKTDKADYAPGEIVIITGSGWQPGETVTLTMVESPLIDTHGPFTTVADSTGRISNNQFVVDSHDIGIRFYLAAAGAVSQAQATFTDGKASDGDGSMSVSPVTVPVSSSGNNFTFTFSAPNGKDFNAGSQTTITVPSGWTAPTGGTGGNVSVAIGTCTATSLGTIIGTGPWTIPINMTCNGGTGFTVTYNGITAPAATGVNTFTTNTKQNGGTLTNIASSPTVTVNNPAPTTTSISPTTKNAGDAAFTLTVNGANFVSNSVVNFNGSARTTTFINANQLTASITAADVATSGSFPITVTNPAPGGGTSNAQTLAVNNLVPTTTSISPASKNVGDAGFTLTVNGTNFVSTSVVNFNGSARTTTFVNASQLTASIPATDLTTGGTFSITITNPAPGGGTSNAQTFTVNNNGPTTTSIAPASATAGGAGFILTVNGTNFVSTSVVNFAGSARTTTFVSNVKLTATIPATDLTTTGTFNVTVTNPAPGGGTSNAQIFTVNNPLPTTTTISPANKNVGDATFTLTVNGTNFVTSSTVNFNGSARTTTFVSATQVTASIPATDLTTAGTFNITVTNPAPGGGTSNAQTLTVNNLLPTTTSISPSSKNAGDAAFTLTINGTNFVSTSVVNFNGSARTTTFVSAVQLTASITAADVATAGTFNITVTNSAPGGGTSNAQTLTVSNPVPTTTSISPVTKTAGDAAFTLTVNGTNFVAGSVVDFNGSPRTTTFVTATQLTAAITAADVATVGTFNIMVVNAAPGGGTSNAQVLTVNPKLVITSAAFTTVTGVCSPTITAQTQNGNGTGSNGARTLTLSGPATAKFFSDAACLNQIASVGIASGSSSASFFYTDTTQGNSTLTVGSTGLTAASQTESYTGLRFGTGAFSVALGQCSSAFVIQSGPASGPAVSPTQNVTVTLSSSSTNGKFYSDAACAIPITTSLIGPGIDGGHDTGSIFYKDTSAGSPTITATAGTASSTQTETVSKITPTFTVPASQQITYGTASITLSGSIAAGSFFPPSGETVSITINSVATPATIGANGAFSATVNTSAIPASSTAYAIAYSYAGDANFNVATNNATTLTVNKATPTFTVPASQQITFGTASITLSGTIAAGSLFPPNGETASITINGVQTPATIAANGAFSATVNTSAIPASIPPYTIAYSYAGDTDFNSATNSATTLTVNQASQTISVTIPAPGTAVYNTNFTVAATGGASGNAVTFSSGGVCTNAGSTFTMTSGTGICTVKFDQAGNSNYSAATEVTENVTAQPASQTITVTTAAPASAAYNTSFTVAATGGASGNAVTFSSGGVCSNTGATFTMTSGTGTCTVKFDQAGNSNYSAATEVTEFVTAQQATAMVMLSNLTQTYTGSPLTPSAATSPTGLTVNFTYTLGGNPVTSPTNAGSYAVTATVIDPNYQGSGGGTFTINQADTLSYVTSTPNASKFGDLVTLTATVSAVAPGAGTPTGQVQFKVDGNPLGALISLVSGSASTSTSSLSVTSQGWGQLAPTGTAPVAPCGAAVVGDGQDNLIVFGAGSANCNNNGVFVLNHANGLGGTPSWVQLSPAGGPPPVRHAEMAAYDPTTNSLIIFGGCLGGCFPVTNDVWVLSHANGQGGTPTWTQLSPTGTPPAPRIGGAAAYDPATNRMIIFAGQNGGGSAGATFDDIWVLANANGTGGSPAWTQLSPTGGSTPGHNPPGQYFPSSFYDAANNRLTVAGGDALSSGVQTNAVWVLANANGIGGTPTWTSLIAEGAAGSPADFSNWPAVYDLANNRGLLHDQASNNVWGIVNANGLGGPAAWVSLNPNGGPSPTPSVYGMAYDSASSRLSSFYTNGAVWEMSTAVHSITATYIGDGNFNASGVDPGSTATALPQTVNATVTQLGFSTSATSGVINQCLGPITVETQNSSGTPNNPASTVQIDLSIVSGGSGFFYSDSACASSATTSVSIPSSQNSRNFYFQGTSAGSPITIEAADHAGVLTAATQNETVAKRSTTTALTLTSSTITYGQSTTANVTVTDNATGSASYPQGTIAFSTGDGTDTLGTCTLSSANPATCSASVTPTQVGTGSRSITATFTPTDTIHLNSSSSVSSLTISKAAASVTPAAASKIYGTADPSFTGTLTGFLTADGVTASYSRAPGETVAGSPYTISAALSPASVLGNYNITYNTANFTITGRPITVTPTSGQSKVYGTSDPTLAYAITSGTLVSGDSFSGMLSRVSGENVGTYAITLGSLTAGSNYILTVTPGVTFAISARPVTVTADPQTKIFGASDPPLTYQITSGSLVTGDSFSGALTRASGENVLGGPYAITQGTLSLSNNYLLTFVGNNLTISPAPVLITVSDPMPTYDGQPHPANISLVPFVGNAVTYTGNTVTYPTSPNPPSAAGVYTVSVMVTDTNYAGMSSGTLTIKQATPAFSNLSSPTINYGQSTTSLGGTISLGSLYPTGSVSITLNSVTMPATINAADGTFSASFDTHAIPASTTPYPIAYSYGGDANFTVISPDGTGSLTVNAIPLYVIANDKSRIYGAGDPSFDAQYFGFVNGDTPASLGNLACMSKSNATSSAGSYAIHCGGLTSVDYTIHYVDGTLAISDPLSAIAVNPSAPPVTYGAMQTFTAQGTFTSPMSRTLGNAGGAVYPLQASSNIRTGTAAAEANGKLYIIGGINSGTPTQVDSLVEMYDPTSNAAPVAVASMGKARSNARAISLAGKVYVVGGCSKTDCTSLEPTAEVYDPAGDRWTPISTSGFTPRRSMALGVINGKIYAAGGNDSLNTPLATVEVYDPATDSWASAPSMPPLGPATGGVINGNFYVAGVSSGNASIQVFDGTGWSTVSAPAQALSDAAVAVLNNVLYFFDGASIHAYDPMAHSWSNKASLNTARLQPEPVTIGNLIYVADNDATATIAVVESFASDEAKWSTSDSTVAPIDQSGKATAAKVGSATITATSIQVPSISGTASMTVTPATVTPNVTVNNKTYDGNTSAVIATETLTGVLNGDDVQLIGGNAVFADKNVGIGKTVNITGLTLTGSTAGNYQLSSTSATTNADITARNLTVTATGIDKQYDAKTTATVTLSDNRISGDILTDNYTSASFADKNVGSGKTVSVTGISISGTDAGNYSLSNTTASTTASISQRLLTVSAAGVDKQYDATTAATVTLSDNHLGGDVVIDNYASATFADKNVGSSKTVSVTGISISGSDAGNYSLSNTTASTTASISQRPLTVSATGVDKQYDAKTTATVTLSDNRISGDILTDNYASASFADKNVGSGKTVSVTGISISGTDAGNYLLSNTTATTTATITPAPLTITASSGMMIYGGTPPMISPMYSGFVGGDTASSLATQPVCATTATSTSPVSGNPYVSTCAGAVDSNYTISYAPGSVLVNQATTTTALVLTPTTINFGQGTTVSATVNPQFSGTATGTLSVSDGVGNVTGDSCTITLVGATGTCTLTPSAAASSPATVSGTYSGDTNFQGSSGTASLTVNPAATSTLVSSSKDPSNYGESVIFTATVTDTTSGDTAVPTGGTVQFVVDGVNFGSPVDLSAGTATSTVTTSLATGEHVITAVFAGDTDFTGSTSPFLIQLVNNNLSSIAVTPTTPTIVVGQTQRFVDKGTFADGSSAILPPGATWAVGNSMTNPVSAPMAAAGNNGTTSLLYLFGGQDGLGAENFVQTYNPATGTWSSASNTGFTARHQGTAIASGNGLIYVIGGSQSTPVSTVEAYDPAHDTWTSRASIPHASACSVGGAINGLIYVLTGCDGNPGFSNEFDAYNPANNTWSGLTSPAHTHNAGAGSVINGKFYVAGGYDQLTGTTTNIVESYDPQTSTWTTMTAMPAALGQLAGAVFNQKLYVVGGVDGNNNPQSAVYVYDPTKEASTPWSQLSSPLSQGRSNIGLVAFDGLLYAAGGGDPSLTGMLEVLDTDDVTWASDTPSVATVNANTGVATGLTPGTANISATSSTYSVSGKTQLTVIKADTTTSVASSANPSTYGQAVTFTATVNVNAPGMGTPTGTVNLYDGGTCGAGTTLASGLALTSGSATFTTASLSAADSPHSIVACYSGDTNFNATGTSSSAATPLSQIVNKATPIVTVSFATSPITYDGNTHPATTTVTGVNNSDLTGHGTVTINYTPGGASAPLSANSYTASAHFASTDGNYTDADSTVAASLVISKAHATISVTPYSVTYDAAAHTAAGTATGVKNESLSGLDLTGTTHTNAGDYTTDSWKFTDVTGNYYNESGTVHDHIDKANPVISVTPYNVTYDGNTHTATGTATGVKGESLSGLVLTGTTHTSAGTYASDAWTFTDVTGNYNNSGGTVSDSIAKANPVISVTPYNVTYDGNAHTATGTATGVKNESLSGLDLSGTSHSNAGTTTDTWTFTDTTGNYNNATATVSDSIAKASSTTTVTCPTDVTFDGTPQTPCTASTSGVAGLSQSLSVSYANNTNAGLANASAIFAGDANHNGSNDSKNFTIDKAISTTVVSCPTSVTYNGSAQTPCTVSVTGAGGLNQSPVPNYNNNTVAGTAGASYNFAGDTNHTGSSDSKTFTIAKANATITVTPYNVAYDGNSHTAIGAATGVKGENLTGLVLTGTTHTSAGTYVTDAWTFTDVTGNYNNASGTVVDNISQASATINVVGYIGVYDGNAHGATGSAAGVESPMPANLNGLLHLGSSFTNVPGGTAYWTFDGNNNYKSANGSVAIVISQASTTTAVASSVNPSTFMQLVAFTATVTPQYSGTIPTGTVTFYNNASSIGTVPLSVSSCGTPPCTDQATFSTPSLPDSGPDSITAVYSGDVDFVTSTSPAIKQTVQPAPNVSLSPMSVSFGNQNVNTSSKPATVTLSNIGDAPLYISTNGISIIPSTDFVQTNNCGSTLAAGGSCKINITFTPVDTGIRTANLQITDNDDDATNAQQTVSLTGAGLSTITGSSLYTDALFATANGCASIVMSGGSTVDSFNSTQGFASSHLLSGGNVGTNGNVTLNGGKSAIYGSAAVPIMTTGNCSKTSLTGVTTSGGAQLTGALVPLNSSLNYPVPPAPTPAPPITQNISGSCGSISTCTNTGTKTVSLAPGQYGNLSISGGTTAHFSQGTYNVNSLTLTGQSILHVDSGPVVINLAGASLSGGNAAMDASGGTIQNPSGNPAYLQFTYAGSRGLNLSGGSASYATVDAPNALVNMSGGSDFFGSVIASTVTNSGGTAMHYDTNLPAISNGKFIWFNAVVNNVAGLPSSGQVKLYLTNSMITFTANNTNYAVPVPNAVVTFNSSVALGTAFSTTSNRWSTSVPKSSLAGNTFVTGVAFAVPSNFPTGIQNVAWSSSFSTDTPGITLQWQWGAAVYNSFSTTYATTTTSNVLGVNAEDGTDPAGTPETYKTAVLFGATGGGGTNYTGYFTPGAGVVPTVAPMSISPSSLDFGQVNQGTTSGTPLTTVVTNNDSNPHTFAGVPGNPSGIQIMGTNKGDFTLITTGANNCLPMTGLASGASCTLYVTFTPSDVGTRTAKIVLNDDANNSPQTVYLSGAGQ